MNSPLRDPQGGPTLGVQPWLQGTDVDSIVRFAHRADALGYSGIWAPDHLLSPHGDHDQAVYEAVAILAAWATTTERALLGGLVLANTFRNPFVLMKSLVTIDHLSRGRVVLGVGGGWWQKEHERAGLEFGASPGERLRWLADAMSALRDLRDGTPHSGEGRYPFSGARMSPRPLGPMPFMIGGSGEQKTLRIVAEFADMWNARGGTEHLRHKLARLGEICEEIGRDPNEIVRTSTFALVIRDDPKEAERVWESLMDVSENPRDRRLSSIAAPDSVWFGPPSDIANRLQPYVDLGFDHLVFDFPAPFDEETLERLEREVRPLLRRRLDPEVARERP